MQETISPRREILALCRVANAGLRTVWFRLANSESAGDRKGMSWVFADMAMLLEASLVRQPKRGKQRLAPHNLAGVTLIAEMLRELAGERKANSEAALSEKEDAYLRSAFQILTAVLKQEAGTP